MAIIEEFDEDSAAVLRFPSKSEGFDPVECCLGLLESGSHRTPKAASEATLLEFEAVDPVGYWQWLRSIADAELRRKVTEVRRRDAQNHKRTLLRNAVTATASNTATEEDQKVLASVGGGWLSLSVAIDPQKGIRKALGECSKADLVKPIAMQRSLRDAAEAELGFLTEIQRAVPEGKTVSDVFTEERIAAIARLVRFSR